MLGDGGLHPFDDGFRIGIGLAEGGEETVGTEDFMIRILRLVQAVRV